jgi:hypothetical protein
MRMLVCFLYEYKRATHHWQAKVISFLTHILESGFRGVPTFPVWYDTLLGLVCLSIAHWRLVPSRYIPHFSDTYHFGPHTMATSSSLDVDTTFTQVVPTQLTVSRSQGLGTGPGTGLGTGRGTGGASTAPAAVSTDVDETPSDVTSEPQTALAVGWTITALFLIVVLAALLFFWRRSKRNRPLFRRQLSIPRSSDIDSHHFSVSRTTSCFETPRRTYAVFELNEVGHKILKRCPRPQIHARTLNPHGTERAGKRDVRLDSHFQPSGPMILYMPHSPSAPLLEEK